MQSDPYSTLDFSTPSCSSRTKLIPSALRLLFRPAFAGFFTEKATP
jgi:hypothetical protein